MNFALVAGIVFAGVLTQSMIGFGVALVTMPLLITILDPTSAGMLVSLFALPLELIIIRRYRHALTIRPFWRIIAGALIGIPLGVVLLTRLDQAVILHALGVLLIGYALYSLLKLRLPVLHAPEWGFGFGFVSGILSGAYNTGGPPLVIYGTCKNWQPEQFKANLQAMMLVTSAASIISRIAAGHLNALVLANLAVALPMVIAGSAAGFWLSRTINAALFRRAVLIMLLLIGVRLLLP